MALNEIKITDECIIYNDMPRGWVNGTNSPRWHLSLYTRWKQMWHRCKNPTHKNYHQYKDCNIDDNYKFLSIYVEDISRLVNFDKLKQNPSKWSIDKDIKNPKKKGYYFENLSIVLASDNIKERNKRKGLPYEKRKRSVIGVPVYNDILIVLDYTTQPTIYNFNPSTIVQCCKGKIKIHKGYRWYYININKL